MLSFGWKLGEVVASERQVFDSTLPFGRVAGEQNERQVIDHLPDSLGAMHEKQSWNR